MPFRKIPGHIFSGHIFRVIFSLDNPPADGYTLVLVIPEGEDTRCLRSINL